MDHLFKESDNIQRIKNDDLKIRSLSRCYDFKPMHARENIGFIIFHFKFRNSIFPVFFSSQSGPKGNLQGEHVNKLYLMKN